jgi:HAD superfamily hydrolase (TIGR01490 family)
MEYAACFFDMDHTLIDNDCDVSWKTFLVEHGCADAAVLKAADVYYQQYLRNELDIAEFIRFQLAEFAGRTAAEMTALSKQHFEEKVKDRIFADARATVMAALRRQVPVCIVTSTNEVVAAPVAAELGIPFVLATRPEIRAGRYTGDISGVYCSGSGKVTRAAAFCRERGICLDNAAYYGDSLADIPLLKAAGGAYVVNPAPALRETAEREGWQILQWR